MKLLLSGDLHLGCSSTRLPPESRDLARTLTAWQRLVDAALQEKVSAVLLSGDIVDHSNRFWESLGPLKEGILKLHAAGIRTLAVSGNHDADVLPHLARLVPPEAFTLLGADGTWQRETLLDSQGSPVLHVDGWSFPASRVQFDPTLSYPVRETADALPVLAMVHGDPGVADSPYAPLNLPRLQSLPVSAWLLGHIHRPSLTPGTPWILMPGTPQPLDPGEPGPHHAWITDLQSGHLPPPVPFCPSRLLYRPLDLLIQPEDPPSFEWITRRLQQEVDASPHTGLQLLRVRLHGRSRDPEALRACIHALEDWTTPDLAVETVLFEVHPELDLREVAAAGPVPALLCRALEAPPSELTQRLESLCASLQQQTEFRDKSLPPLDPENLPLSELLEQALRETLRQLS
ncbi:MAG: DNA repair exonuclease [Kiritimatiellia bacterium]